jgi:hypothetical protein
MDPNRYWVIFANMTDKPMKIVIEPYTIRWEMPKGDNFYVYMKQSLNHLPNVLIHDDVIQIYADEAVIYHEKEKIWDWMEEDIPPPTFI